MHSAVTNRQASAHSRPFHLDKHAGLHHAVVKDIVGVKECAVRRDRCISGLGGVDRPQDQLQWCSVSAPLATAHTPDTVFLARQNCKCVPSVAEPPQGGQDLQWLCFLEFECVSCSVTARVYSIYQSAPTLPRNCSTAFSCRTCAPDTEKRTLILALNACRTADEANAPGMSSV